MKIVLAPDSFKGSLAASEAAATMKKAILETNGNHSVITKPMADGGEGTLEAILSATDGRKVRLHCTGPLGNEIETNYAMLESRQAVIELALIAGLVQVPERKRNPDHTTTFGLGEVIRDALDKGCTSMVIGLGGSATNDGGFGMLLALGMKAWEENGNTLDGFGRNLHRVKNVDLKGLDPRLQEVEIKVAVDVDNPLCGKRGASVVFGPQKGASPTQVLRFDKAMERYALLIEKEMGEEWKHVPGTGAAGGLGFGLSVLGAELVSGAALVANTLQLGKDIQKADLVITGEGKSDEQTLYGKAPGYVAELAKQYGVPVVLISGSLTGDLDTLREKFSGCFSIVHQPMSLEECMEQAESLLYEQTKQVLHFIEAFHL